MHVYIFFLRFEKEKQKIDAIYDETERCLIEEFRMAQTKDDFKKMKEIAEVLSNFKGYSRCIDEFIEYSQAVRFCLFLFYFMSI